MKRKDATVKKKEEEIKSHQDTRVCYMCGKRILKRLSKSLNYQKVRNHCHYTGECGSVAHSIFNLLLNVPKEIPEVIHIVHAMIIILS